MITNRGIFAVAPLQFQVKIPPYEKRTATVQRCSGRKDNSLVYRCVNFWASLTHPLFRSKIIEFLLFFCHFLDKFGAKFSRCGDHLVGRRIVCHTNGIRTHRDSEFRQINTTTSVTRQAIAQNIKVFFLLFILVFYAFDIHNRMFYWFVL